MWIRERKGDSLRLINLLNIKNSTFELELIVTHNQYVSLCKRCVVAAKGQAGSVNTLFCRFLS